LVKNVIDPCLVYERVQGYYSALRRLRFEVYPKRSNSAHCEFYYLLFRLFFWWSI